MSTYEFSPEDSKTLSSLARWLILTGILIFAGGIGSFVQYLVAQYIFALIEGFIFCVMGVVFLLPAVNLRRIATTSGRDIPELMQAFAKLSTGWLVLNLATALLAVVRIISLLNSLTQAGLAR